MPRSKDPVHDHFEVAEDGSLRCKECKDYTTKSRAPIRLVTHLASCTAAASPLREVYKQRDTAAKAHTVTKRPRTDTSATCRLSALAVLPPISHHLLARGLRARKIFKNGSTPYLRSTNTGWNALLPAGCILRGYL
jgi:hypothetical protein